MKKKFAKVIKAFRTVTSQHSNIRHGGYQLAKITLQQIHQEGFIREKEKKRDHTRSLQMHTSTQRANQLHTCKKERVPKMASTFILIPSREVTTKFNRKSGLELTRGPALWLIIFSCQFTFIKTHAICACVGM